MSKCVTVCHTKKVTKCTRQSHTKTDQVELHVLGAESALLTAIYPELLDIMSTSDAIQAVSVATLSPNGRL